MMQRHQRLGPLPAPGRSAGGLAPIIPFPMPDRSSALANRISRRFWLLGLTQAAHSIEEMRTGLYDFFWTATGRIQSLAGAVVFGGYVPGSATAPFLVVTGLGLLRALGRTSPGAASSHNVSP